MSGIAFAKIWSSFLRNQWRLLFMSFPAALATGYVVWRLRQRQQQTNRSINGAEELDTHTVDTAPPLPTANQSTEEPITDGEQPLAGSTLPLSTSAVDPTSISFPSPTDSGFQGGMPSPPDEPKSSDPDYPALPMTPCSLPVGASPTTVDTTIIRGGRARATIQLPIDIIGRFIGRTGKNIKSLMAESGAQIHVQQKNLSKEDSVVPCILQGTQSQINKAVDLICLRHPEVSVPSPQVYITPLPIYSSSLGTNGATVSWDYTLKQPPTPTSIFLAIVTYIEKLNRVWLVPYSSTQLLEELHQSMANSYKTNDTEPDKQAKIIGKSCAVRVNEVYWLRGQVVEVNEESQYEVKLLDYGSSVIVPLSSLRPLRREHTLIPVQSLPYVLSNIQPIHSEGEDGMLVLQALVEGVVLEAHPTGRRSNDDIPYIELYTQPQHGSGGTETQTFINRELVNQGFAVWHETITAIGSIPFTSSDDNTPTNTTSIATPTTHVTTATVTAPSVDTSHSVLSNGTSYTPDPLPSRAVTLSDLLSNSKPVITGLTESDQLMSHCDLPSITTSVTSSSHSTMDHLQKLANSAPSSVDPMKALFGDQLYVLSHSS